MRCADSQLHGLPVVTESGQAVGRLYGLTVETEAHEVVQYTVRKSGALGKLLPKDLLIGREQVVSLNDEKMTVRDAAVGDWLGESVSVRSSGTAPGPALNRTAE